MSLPHQHSQRSADASRWRLNHASKEHRALLLRYGLLVIKLAELMAKWREEAGSDRAAGMSAWRTYRRCADQLANTLARHRPAVRGTATRPQRSAARP